MNKLKIGIDARLLAEKYRRGVGNYIHYTLQSLGKIDQNNEYFLYSHRDFEMPINNEKWHKRVYPGFFGTMWIQTKLKDLMKKDKIDLYWGTIHILPLNIPHSIKTVLIIHDLKSFLLPFKLKLHAIIDKLLMGRSVKLADKLIAISEHTAKDVNRKFKKPLKEIEIVHAGVPDLYSPIDKNTAQNTIYKHYGINKNYILSVGPFEEKEITFLLNAFSKVLTNFHNNLHLILPGKYDRFESIKKLFDKLDLGNNVKFLGYVPKEIMPHLYSAAELFVFPSYFEGFGLPLVEAMACGAPVIATNVTSIPEVIGGAAILVDPGKVNELTNSIYKVLNDKDLRKELSLKGLERAKRFSWDETAAKMLNIINELKNE